MAAFAKTKEASINIPTLELYLKQDFTVWCQDIKGLHFSQGAAQLVY